MKYISPTMTRRQTATGSKAQALCLLWWRFMAAGAACFLAGSTAWAASDSMSPRDTFNAGTQELAKGKLREAEAYLEGALLRQEERFRVPSLYNLGHVRFLQGIEELKKGPAAHAALDRGEKANALGDQAISIIDKAMAGEDINNMVQAYLRGRGARREMKAAIWAIQRALDAHRNTLSKWQRASGDFRSAEELKPAYEDAKHNGDVVDRHIARLIDSIESLQQMASALGDKRKEIGQKMKQMKGKIPAEEAPPGGGEDEDEDEEEQQGLKPGEKEPAGREGKEMNLTPEQAGWLLEGFKLDSERRLPMGQSKEAEPKNRKRSNW
jgi:hypothetical protein